MVREVCECTGAKLSYLSRPCLDFGEDLSSLDQPELAALCIYDGSQDGTWCLEMTEDLRRKNIDLCWVYIKVLMLCLADLCESFMQCPLAVTTKIDLKSHQVCEENMSPKH